MFRTWHQIGREACFVPIGILNDGSAGIGIMYLTQGRHRNKNARLPSIPEDAQGDFRWRNSCGGVGRGGEAITELKFGD